jgi:hypothetical protein
VVEPAAPAPVAVPAAPASQPVARRKPAAARPAAPAASAPSPAASAPAPAVAAAPRVVTDDDIRVRAYFLSVEHKGQGSPEYFWFLAERELRPSNGSK